MSDLDDNWDKSKQHLVDAATAAGIDPGIMARIAGFESGFRTNARPVHPREVFNVFRQFDGVRAMSTGYGYGQFLDGTWKQMINTYGEKHGIANASTMTMREVNDPKIRSDAAIQAAMLAEFTRENIQRGASLGGADADANVYALHNLGAGDARRFLKGLAENPNQPVNSILSVQVVRGNRSLYGDGSRTVAESYRVMGNTMRKFDDYAIEAISMAAEFKGVPYALREPRLLTVGSTGRSVQDLQEDLNLLGANTRDEPLAVDGQYGANTRDAVEAFQRQHDLPISGNADKATLIAIQMRTDAIRPDQDYRHVAQRFQPAGLRDDWMQTNEQGLPNYLRTHSAASQNRPDHDSAAHARGALADGSLKLGERGPEVARLQESLIQLGINERLKDPIKPDGIFGPDTQRAVQAFQLWHGAERITGIADRQTLAAINTQAGLALIQRAVDQAQELPARDFATNVNLGARVDPQSAAEFRGENQTANISIPPSAEPSHATHPAPAERTQTKPTPDAARFSPEDQKMFDKIRSGTTADVPDTIVALAVLDAKRNGIPDADRIEQVGVVDGKLWVGSITPGFHASVPVTGSTQSMQDTLSEIRSTNQQLAEQQTPHGPDNSDPTQGPRR